MINLVMLALGIFSVAFWSALPGLLVALAIYLLAILVSLLLLRKLHGRLDLLGRLGLTSFQGLLFLGAGMLWGIFSAQQLLQDILPESLNGEEFQLTGRIVGLVDRDKVRSRFDFAVESARLLSEEPGRSEELAKQIIDGKILLSWYGAQELRAGQRWQLTARLRRPRGFVNPRAFDYQSWLLQQGYRATGYVRSPQQAEKLPSGGLVGSGYIGSVSAQLREQVKQAVESSDLSLRGRAVLLALSIGDKSRLGDWWQELARLGIVHLLVISGLHIGLVALLGAALGKLLARAAIVSAALAGRIGHSASNPSLHWLPALTGLLAAFAYSLLAGFSLPTQRALIAVAVVVFARLRFRRIQPFVCLVWALALIAVFQPLAVLSAGFWLSFMAVTILIVWFSPWQSCARWWPQRRALSAQLALLLVMSVPLLLFVGRLSWLAPMVNLLAIPWVSALTVPATLVGCLLLPFSQQAAAALWQLSDWSVTALWRLLDLLPADWGFLVSPVGTSNLALAAALLAGLSLLLPWHLYCRWLGVLPLALLLLGRQPTDTLRVTVLDVGQGLAVVVETPTHRLLYDSGARFSDGFSAGSGIVAPYFWQRGYGRIDKTLVSHEDGDHSGGFASLQQVLASGDIITGPGVYFSEQVLNGQSVEICHAGQQWHWDAVLFQMLSPMAAEQGGEQGEEPSGNTSGNTHGNNSSCVLQISWGQIRILLPGDIESAVETQLLGSAILLPAPIDLLVAPHHGSKTSSTSAFVQRLQPKQVVFSAGYQHQFGHPHRSVSERYINLGSRVWNTAEQGAITFEWQPSGELTVSAARSERRYWWR